MSKIKKLPIHNGFATGIKHWHVAHIENTLFSIRDYSFQLIECNAGDVYPRGRKSTYIKAMDLMKLHPYKPFILTLFEMLNNNILEKNINKYLTKQNIQEPENVITRIFQEEEDIYESIKYTTFQDFGLFYIDTPGTIPPFHKFSNISTDEQFNNYDFLINTFPRSWKRHLGKKNPPEIIKKSGVPLLNLPGYINMLNRKYWYIRDTNGLNGAILLFGTNNDAPEFYNWEYEIDMYNIHTPKGKEIFNRHSVLLNK